MHVKINVNIPSKKRINYECKGKRTQEISVEIKLTVSSKTLQQLTKERDELEKVFRLAESLENQKRDEEKTRKLQELIQTKGIIEF